jgi:hypothetical protein
MIHALVTENTHGITESTHCVYMKAYELCLCVIVCVCVCVCVNAWAHRAIDQEMGIFTYEPRCRNRESKVDHFHE